jgi:hypothetical protein
MGLDARNFVVAAALQLSGGLKPKPWMFKQGLNLLNTHIEQRKKFGLPLCTLEAEREQAIKEFKL